MAKCKVCGNAPSACRHPQAETYTSVQWALEMGEYPYGFMTFSSKKSAVDYQKMYGHGNGHCQLVYRLIGPWRQTDANS